MMRMVNEEQIVLALRQAEREARWRRSAADREPTFHLWKRIGWHGRAGGPPAKQLSPTLPCTDPDPPDPGR